MLEKKMLSEKARLEAQGQHLLTAQAVRIHATNTTFCSNKCLVTSAFHCHRQYPMTSLSILSEHLLYSLQTLL
jgi:hypothetical protein